MAGIAYKEEVLSFGTSETILLNYSEDFAALGKLDWAQTFYLESSLLVCKVYQATVILEQLFFCFPEENLEVRFSVENNKKIEIVLPAAVVPTLGLICDQQHFSLYIATVFERVYKFTFYQGVGFSNPKYFKDMIGYIFPSMTFHSFALIRYNEEECDVSLGLNNGVVYFASLQHASTTSFQTPSVGFEVKPPLNFLQNLKYLVSRRPQNEKILRIANIKDQQIVALSSHGILRLYSSSKLTFINELDLETGELEHYKFASFADVDSKSVAFGFSQGTKWWVFFIKVFSNAFEVASKFTEPGELIDLRIDIKGVWSVWRFGSRDSLILKPHNGSSCNIYTFNDEILINDIKDSNTRPNSTEVLKRILAPGRFNKTLLKNAIEEALGASLELESYEDAKILQDISLEQADAILRSLKILQAKELQALGVCCCEEPGNFPPVVIRGHDAIGIIVEIAEEVEGVSLQVQKTVVDNLMVAQECVAEPFSRFKFAISALGFERSLAIIRLWRFQHSACNSFTDSFNSEIWRESLYSMPSHILQLLKRSLPVDLDFRAHHSLQLLSTLFSTFSEKTLTLSQICWPHFLISLLGNSLRSAISAIYEYSQDLSLLLVLCTTSLAADVFQGVQRETLHTSLMLTRSLAAMTRALSSPLSRFPSANSQLCRQLESYSFPVTVAPLYFDCKSDTAFGDKFSFCLKQLSLWLSNAISTSIHEVLVHPEAHVCHSSTVAKLLAYLGEPESVKDYFEALGTRNSVSLFLQGTACEKIGMDDLGQSLCLKAGALIVSGNLDNSYQNLVQGPWNVDPPTESVNMLNLFNSAVGKCFKDASRKKIILSDFIVNSLYAGFAEDDIGKSIESLLKIKCYNEAHTIIQAHYNKKIRKGYIEEMLKFMEADSDFSALLQLPIDHLTKEMVLCYLQSQSANEHFDLLRVISSDRYFERTQSIFKEAWAPECREEYRKNNKSCIWSYITFSFCMHHQYFCSAAEAMYRYTKEIGEFLKMQANKEDNEKEYKFIKEIFREHLMMATLAARNICEDYEKCYFLVTPSTEKGQDGERYLVSLREMEENLANNIE